MSSTAHDVRQCIERDAILREALARDILSYSKLARWLKEARGVEGTEAGIISAIRRIEADAETDVFAVARDKVGDLDLGTDSGFATITVKKTAQTQEDVREVWDLLDLTEGKDARINPGQHALTLVVNHADLQDVLDLLDDDIVENVREDLARLTLTDTSGDATETHGLLALIHTELASNGVNVVADYTDELGMHILVTKQDLDQAFRAIRNLQRDS